MFNSIWYNNLIKPLLTPPSYVFAPVWTILYILILISVVIYASTKTKRNKLDGYVYFTTQLLLNFVWSPVFFYLKDIGLALFIVILLDIFVVLTINEFYKISKFSGLILIPYFVWIIFATYLNLAFLILN